LLHKLTCNNFQVRNGETINDRKDLEIYSGVFDAPCHAVDALHSAPGLCDHLTWTKAGRAVLGLGEWMTKNPGGNPVPNAELHGNPAQVAIGSFVQD